MAESDWSQPSSWSAGGGSMWGAPQQGMQSPYGGGWGGYGMQSPYGGFGGGYGGFGSPYGGFGGGMPYGGGYGMQSPYGAPMGYGGYGMQSPYGGQMYGGYGMQSPYSAYGMPQQQSMTAAPQTQQAAGAPQTMAATEAGGDVTPTAPDGGNNIQDLFLNLGGSTKQQTSFEPWEHQAGMLRALYQGELRDKDGNIEPWTKGLLGAADILQQQQALGPLGFNPTSEAGLKRMEQLAGADNPLWSPARDAVTDIASGGQNIGTGNMFNQMYNDPGITGQQQYQNMANRDAITNDQHYRDMIGQDAVGSRNFNELYNNPGVTTGGYVDLRNDAQNAIGTGRMENIYAGPGVNTGNYQSLYGGAQGPGSLGGGMFGQTASGEMVNANPYREKAIQDAMNQTSDQVKATMSSRGRFGSDAYGDAMGKALGQVATQARMAGYDTDTANMMAAAQARSGEALSRQGIGLQAAQGIAGAQGQNIANRMGAAQSIMGAQGQNWQNKLAAMQGLTGAQSANVGQQMGAAQGLAGLQGTNAAQRLAQIQGLSGIQGQNYQAQLGALGQMNQAQQMAQQQRMAAAQGMTGVQGQNLQNRLQAAGMAPQMQQLRYDDASRMLQAGAAREAMAQQQRNFGWDTLNQYRAQIGNLPGTAGSQSADASQPWWQNALGIGATLGGIYGQFQNGGG